MKILNTDNIKDSSILIVDDDNTNLKILFGIISEIALHIYVAQSGEKAIKIAEAKKPDLIVMDILMPGMNGFETCKLLKSNADTVEIPVVFISALSDTTDKIKGFEVGGVDYITKPFQQDEVIARVTTHLLLIKQRNEIKRTYSLLGNIINSIPDFIYYKDIEGRYLGCNDSFEKLVDINKNAIIGKQDSELEDNIPFNKDLLSKLNKFDGIKTVRSEIVLKSNNEKSKTYLDSLTTPFFDGKGALLGHIGISRDFTTLKTAEAALRESEAKLHTILDTAAEGIIICNNSGVIESFNITSEILFGYTEDKIIGQNIIRLIPQLNWKDVHRLSIEDDKILQNLYSNQEMIGSTNKGNEFPIELSISQARLADKIFYTLILRDITERKKTELEIKAARDLLEEKIQERTAELKALNDQSPISMCVIDIQGNLIQYNHAWENLWNIKNDFKYDILKDPFLESYGYTKQIRRLFKKGGQLITSPIYYEKSSDLLPGKIGNKWLRHRFYSVHSNDGKLLRIVDLVEDVTEAKKAEEIFLELDNQKQVSATIIETLENERKRLSQEIHDGIGQILTTSKLNIELFEKVSGIKDENLEQSKRLILAAATEVESIINELRPMILDTHGLEQAIDMICLDLHKATNIKFTFNAYDLKDRLPSNIELNIFRVVQEALSNIVKHSNASSASIEIFNRPEVISVSIEDNGQGFDTKKTSSVRSEGRFGLTSMKERIKQIGGKLIVESSPGRGTELLFDVPFIRGEKNE